MSTSRFVIVIDKGWYVNYQIQTRNLLKVILQKYTQTKFEQRKILGQNYFLMEDNNLKSCF